MPYASNDLVITGVVTEQPIGSQAVQGTNKKACAGEVDESTLATPTAGSVGGYVDCHKVASSCLRLGDQAFLRTPVPDRGCIKAFEG